MKVALTIQVWRGTILETRHDQRQMIARHQLRAGRNGYHVIGRVRSLAELRGGDAVPAERERR